MFKVTYSLTWRNGRVNFTLKNKYTGIIYVSSRIKCEKESDFDIDTISIKNDKPNTRKLRAMNTAIYQLVTTKEFTGRSDVSSSVSTIVKKYKAPRILMAENTLLYSIADKYLDKRNELALEIVNYNKQRKRVKGVNHDRNALKTLKMFAPELTEKLIANDEFPERYYNWLTTQFTERTASQYYKRVSAIIRALYKKSVINEHTFKAFAFFSPDTPSSYKSSLSHAELKLLDKLNPDYDFMNENMLNENMIRITYDMFMLSCGIGWRLSDIQHLKLSNIFTINGNELVMQVMTQKKGVKATVNLSTLYNGRLLKHISPYIRHKDEKWEQELLNNGNPNKEDELLFATMFTKITNSVNYPIMNNVNTYVRIILSSCDIDSNHTFHTARHTAITMLCGELDNPFKLASTVGVSVAMADKVYIHYQAHAKDDVASIEKIIKIIDIENI